MASPQEFTYADVAKHSDKQDMYVVIHDKVYNTSSFVEEHPGGEEVLLDLGGQDATDAFEDVGHSDEARDLLVPMLLGDLKRMPGDPSPKVKPPPQGGASKSPSANADGAAVASGYLVYIMMALGAIGAYLLYSMGMVGKSTTGEL